MDEHLRFAPVTDMYLLHAELTTLQGLTEAHFPVKEASLVSEAGGLLEHLTHWSALREVGMETNRNLMSGINTGQKFQVLF